MPAPNNVKQLRYTLGHTGYYWRFIRNYGSITTHLEKLFKKAEVFFWTLECESGFNLLKDKLVSARILVFPHWNIEFNVHVDAFGI